jgi:hypothetical protein
MCAFGFILSIFALCTPAQTPNDLQQIATEDGKQEMIPIKAVEFKAVETDPGFTLPAASVDYPHCLSDGSLVLHDIDWEAVMKTPKGKFPRYNEIVTVIRGKKTQKISSASISDLTDFNNGFDIFPADSGIYFLVQGSKEQPGERGPGKSPMGIPLKDFRNYIARFDLDGSYKGATELGIACDLSRAESCHLRHLAAFPSGDMLVSESDPETSTLKVLYLKSSGEVVKQIEVPASRKIMNWGDPSSSPDVRRDASTFLSSVYFTAVGDRIVVWRANSNDPVVEVSQGGGAREVPIQIPEGWRFADLVASNDRWVVHFRTENTPPTVNMSADKDAYFEVRSQDGSLAARIMQDGDAPLSIACESNGIYTSFKWSDAGNKMALLEGK